MSWVRGALALALSLVFGSVAFAQTSGGFTAGQPLSAAQLNAAFSAKEDYGQPDGTIRVGNSSNFGVPVTFTGDATVSDTGHVTVTGVNGIPFSIGTSGSVLCLLNTPCVYSAALTDDLNAVTLPTGLTGDVLRLGQADGTVARVELDAFGAIPTYSCVRWDGTAASKTTVQAADELCGLGAAGYDSATVATAAKIRFYAAQNWTTSAHGTYDCLAVTPNGSITMADVFCLNQDGGITVGSPTGGDLGANSLNVQGTLAQNGVSVLTSALASTDILVGNVSGVATAVTLSGDGTISNAGALTLASSSGTRTHLGLAIGTNVEAWDADLDALAALSGTNTIYYRSASNTWSAVTIGAGITFSGGTLSVSTGGTSGSWPTAPVFSFTTPGNLSVTYNAGRFGTYTCVNVTGGSLVSVEAHITASAFTFTTASGSLTMGPLPFALTNTANGAGGTVTINNGNVTWASGYLSLQPLDSTHFTIVRNISGSSATALTPSNFTTGSPPSIDFTATYQSAATCT